MALSQASFRGFRTRQSFVEDRQAFTEHMAAHSSRPDVHFDRSLREQLEYKMNALDYEVLTYPDASAGWWWCRDRIWPGPLRRAICVSLF